jgi:hypothetical protein
MWYTLARPRPRLKCQTSTLLDVVVVVIRRLSEPKMS